MHTHERQSHKWQNTKSMAHNNNGQITKGTQRQIKAIEKYETTSSKLKTIIEPIQHERQLKWITTMSLSHWQAKNLIPAKYSWTSIKHKQQTYKIIWTKLKTTKKDRDIKQVKGHE